MHKIAIFSDELENVKQLNFSLQKFESDNIEFEKSVLKYLLLLDQTILLHFRNSIDRPLNLPQYPGSNNYFSIPEGNI
jgi:hypothetical protein